jgi:capsular exopolysaccharide synthesis family protein
MSSYSNNQNMVPNTLDEEIDLKDIFATLQRYKTSIAVIVAAVTLLAAVYVYFSTSIYQANLTLQIQQSSANGGKNAQGDFMADALDAQGQSVDNEIPILQSYSIAQKALEKIQIGTQYYTIKNLRTVELYKDTPFVVNADAIVERLIGQKIKLHPLDANHFELVIEPTFSMKISNLLRSLAGPVPLEKQPVYFKGKYTYGAIITSPLFKITVNKIGEMVNDNYAFTITPNEYMFPLIQESLKVTVASDKSSVLQLSYEDSIPERAQSVLNAIAEAYKEQSIEVKNGGAKKTLAFIDQQLKGINDALQNSASNLENYKSSHIVIDPEQKGVIASQKIAELQTQRDEIDMQLSVLDNLLTYINTNKDTTGIDVGSMSTVSAPILSLIEKIQAADAMHTALINDYTEKHPSVIKIADQITKLRTNLKATIESSLRGMRQRKATLENIMSQNNTALEAIPAQEKQLSQLSNSFAVNQKVYEYLLQKRAETAIVESSTVSSVRVIDQALVGELPIKPKSLLIILVGFILGWIIGIAQALIRNYMHNTIQTINDVRKNTSLPLLGTLPYFTNKKTLYEDSLRKLFTKIKSMGLTQKTQLITFTSSIYGEGKTTTAYEFANVIAKTGKKIILLDMDMRRASIHNLLNIPNTKGILTYLSDQSMLEESIQHLQPKFDVMTVGACETCSYDLLSSDKFIELIELFRSEYDYIVFISPPSGLVADALVLMGMSDLSVMIFKAEYSKKTFINEINVYTMEHELHNVCVVLNGLELSKVRPWRTK